MGMIWDRIVVWFCCLTLMYAGEINTECVIGMLTAVVISSITLYFDQRAVKTALVVVYAFLCAVFDEFLWMMPVAVYELCYQKEWMWLSIYLLPAVLHPEKIGIQAALLAISIILAYKTRKFEYQKAEYQALQDKYSELKIRMERGQKEMALRQDGELRLATLTERNRIAREIHDNVGHLLSRSILQAGAMRAVNEQDNLSELLGALQETLNAAMNQIRESVHDLKDEAFDLESMVRGLAAEYSNLILQLDYDMPESVPRNLKYCFAAIIREALTNTVKHSNATKVTIVLREHPALYQLLIQDNGNTKECSEAANKNAGRKRKNNMEDSDYIDKYSNNIISKNSINNDRKNIKYTEIEHNIVTNKNGNIRKNTDISDGRGMGLEGMRERVESFHGRIVIEQKNGFRIFITIPNSDSEYR